MVWLLETSQALSPDQAEKKTMKAILPLGGSQAFMALNFIYSIMVCPGASYPGILFLYTRYQASSRKNLLSNRK
jgi:hypothetical protein